MLVTVFTNARRQMCYRFNDSPFQEDLGEMEAEMVIQCSPVGDENTSNTVEVLWISCPNGEIFYSCNTEQENEVMTFERHNLEDFYG